MGCKNSKTVRVQPVGPAAVSIDNTNNADVEIKDNGTQTIGTHKHGNNNEAFEYDIDSKGNKIKDKNKIIKKKTVKRSNSIHSTESLDDNVSNVSDRGFSATSKSSQQSTDSGLGDDYATIITENSSKEIVEKIEEDFGLEKELDLGITGKACPVRLSAKDKNRLEESMILQSLREEGLITKPKAESAGGISFEITTSQLETIVRPPPRLAKLEKKKKKVLTEEEIKEKLERAENRRKRKEEERLQKIKEKDKSDTLAALESFAQHQKEKGEQVYKKMDQVQDKRQQRLNEIREKIHAKERHAEKVRQRKQAALENGEVYNDESSFDDSF